MVLIDTPYDLNRDQDSRICRLSTKRLIMLLNQTLVSMILQEESAGNIFLKIGFSGDWATIFRRFASIFPLCMNLISIDEIWGSRF